MSRQAIVLLAAVGAALILGLEFGWFLATPIAKIQPLLD